MVIQIAFLWRSYASFELPEKCVCSLISVSQTDDRVDYLTNGDIFLDPKKKKKVINPVFIQ